MKKKIIILIIGILVIGSSICLYNNYKYKNSDQYKFKKEYESLNGKKSESGKIIRSLNIPKDNRIKYATAKEIIKMMKEHKSFVVYFGFNECPWCRSVVNNLISAAKEKNIKTIYYVNVENIRDVKELKDGNIITTKKGNKYYLE